MLEEPLNPMTHYTRLGIILGFAMLAVAGVFILPPLVQDTGYHDFADKRAFLGIPNFFDVLSNLPFLIVGASGLIFLKTDWNKEKLFVDASEKWLWLALFCALTLTGFGSAYYHYLPDNGRLVWDRLFIALTLMALLSIVMVERMHLSWRVFPLLALYAIGSVFYWDFTEQRGVGDLRPYILAQFFPLAAIPLIMALFPTRHRESRQLIFAFGWYALAKLFEHFDKEIFEMLKVSGHTLKHLTAGLGAYCLLRYIKCRYSDK
jgi:hypothetical protein